MDNQKMFLQQYDLRRGPISRYNSVDNGLLASPHPLDPYVYTNLVSIQCQQNHKVVQVHHPQPQPPLLPLPTTRPQHSSLPLRTSSGRLARKPKRHDSDNLKRIVKESSSLKELGSNKKPIQFGSSSDVIKRDGKEDQRVFSDLVFTQSPHPSSLPLPKFFMRQKAAQLSCKAEAQSSDDVRRVLQLR
ncbi:hypothetical protein QQ045_014706 [Rhodiola kirilowii]